jgi:hypothetical protein
MTVYGELNRITASKDEIQDLLAMVSFQRFATNFKMPYCFNIFCNSYYQFLSQDQLSESKFIF